MVSIYSMFEGPFGRAEVVEHSHNLVMHAHSQTHFVFWLGGGEARAHVASEQVVFGRQMVLGINSLMSHDLRLAQVTEPAVFLMLYVNDDWLDGVFSHLGRPVLLPQVNIPIDLSLQKASWQLMRQMVAVDRSPNQRFDEEVLWLVQHTVAQAFLASPDDMLPLRRRMVDYRLRVAMAHMRKNLANPTVAEEVADVVGLSRSRFFELFLRPIGHFTQRLLERHSD